MGNSCNHEHEEEIKRKMFAKIYFRASICHHSDFFMYSVFLSSYTNTRESLGELEKAFLVPPNFHSCLY